MRVRVQAEFPRDIAGPFYDAVHSFERLPIHKISEWLAMGWKVTLTEKKK